MAVDASARHGQAVQVLVLLCCRTEQPPAHLRPLVDEDEKERVRRGEKEEGDRRVKEEGKKF